jgi:hypothetical protein
MKFSDTISYGTLTTILKEHFKVFNLKSGDQTKYDILDKIKYEWSVFCDLDASAPSTWQESWERFINYATMTRSISLTQEEVETFSNALLNVVPEFSNMREGSNILDREVTFNDGRRMVLQVISSKDEPCWSQVVLFEDNGEEIACSEVSDTLINQWELDSYILNVNAA